MAKIIWINIVKTEQSPGAASSYSKSSVWSFRGLVTVLTLGFFLALLKYTMEHKYHVHWELEHIMFNPLCLPNNKTSFFN